MSSCKAIDIYREQIRKDLSDSSILIKDFDSNIFGSRYFISSWVRSEDLDIHPLVKLIDKLHLKDRERDIHAKRPEYLFVFNVFTKETRIISVTNFKAFSLGFKKELFSLGYDIYVPRSVWFKSFCMLNGNSSKDLEFLNSYL